MRIGILTGGGDAPGLNGIIESTSRVLLQNNCEVVGIQDGFDGVFNKRTIPLTLDVVHHVHAQSGTLLGSSNKTSTVGREKEFNQRYRELRLDGLIACGGDGTFSGLAKIVDGINLIGVPKTIDNDLSGTEATFGFDTACACVAENVDALRFTAMAHSRVFVVETMGRTAGWIALGGGLASYADVILIPERPFDRAALLKFILAKKKQGRRDLMVVISEGATAIGEEAQVAFEVEGSPQKERYGGVAFALSRWIEQNAKWESRHVVLGHLQRARQPTTTDRFLTSAMGVQAAEAALAKNWGQAIVYRHGRISCAPITDLMQPARLVDTNHRWVQQAQALGLFI